MYALLQLGLSDLKLKNEQKQTIYAVYGGKDVCLLTGFGENVWFSDASYPLQPQVWLDQS